MKEFNDVINELELIDSPLHGRKFTWSNKRMSPSMARLDRVFFNSDWEDIFPFSKQQGLSSQLSDHAPISFDFGDTQCYVKKFRFENIWLRSEEFINNVPVWWRCAPSSGSAAKNIVGKLRFMRKCIKQWMHSNFHSVRQQKKDLLDNLLTWEVLEENRDLSDDELIKKNNTVLQLNEILLQEERMWKQRSKVQWLKEGDHNTKYFHKIANGRKRSNLISSITYNNVEISSEDGIAQIDWGPNDIEQPFSVEEVHKAIFDMSGDKSPGPDGFSALFFQVFWDIVKDDIMKLFEEFYEGFIKNRYLLDGVVVAQEIINDCFQNKKRGGILLKLDFVKAYDMLDWNFILDVLKAKKFGDKWVNWVKLCLHGGWFGFALENDESLQQGLATMMNCKSGSFPITYLGVPLRPGKLKKDDWSPLIVKIEKRLALWKGNSLSQGGRLVLVNAVLSSIPTFWLSYFLFPLWVIEKIDKMRRRFLWIGSLEHKGCSNLVKWEEVCKPKKCGGLGVKNLKVMNKALLGKWLWKWFDVLEWRLAMEIMLYSGWINGSKEISARAARLQERRRKKAAGRLNNDGTTAGGMAELQVIQLE
ncbi:uncharacterized protein LOC109846046 [Asparagus officinalis]|uniref:uncharacterized protein LOC109846046 n=1 Tax=Asparagus officinalis TaxID=4686 RepID=UPI00098E16DE|nr:uncharacterized protein LOC109846046 [Asparagus officinalis]